MVTTSNDPKTLFQVLQAKQYSVVEASNGPECIDKALSLKPDMIIVDWVFSEHHNLVQPLRFEKEIGKCRVRTVSR